ncbi:MAG: single-stranded-DNA-specific exonuclease RecJ [Candidatus Dadabacteria bacterium]|nr:single-stranded-DNA-specific exonuclease RecJ [Candidatus Dadabacteria bacterium]NIQ15319.1 single-stranded-DNA-specific exonuclease RecJ [Candidatus Dadabacteria bacterium]
MTKKKWVVSKKNSKLSKTISDKLNISPVTAQVLINRGIKSAVEAEGFLNPSLFDLPSPFLMKDMQRAVDRLKQAILENELVAVYGDYDVDGVTGTSLLYNFLKFLDCNVIYYNPDRFKEGYGINIEAINFLNNQNVKLIVSVDCGITAVDEIEEAKKFGIDFIITDHHRPPKVLPNATAILNPHQVGCDYPGKEIAGVSVVFNLSIALRRTLREEGFFKESEPNLGDYLDLVALGTVADCAPLLNINRIVVKEGLKRMENPRREGLKALKQVSGIKGKVTSYDLGFKLGPRINAMGRLSSASEAVKLFVSDQPDQVLYLAEILNEENSNRQSIEKQIMEEAINMIDSNPELLESNSLVLSSEDWHQGVIGIVASRIVELYNKPAFLIAVDENGVGKGSGRSVKGIDLYKILSESSELFHNFGGHEQAAGITINKEFIDEFRNKLSSNIDSIDRHYEIEINIDSILDFDDLNDELVSELQILSPYGIGNPMPTFMTESVEVLSQKVFKDKHINFKVRKSGKVFDAMWFNVSKVVDLPKNINIAFTPEFNDWNGKKDIRLTIKDANYN